MDEGQPVRRWLLLLGLLLLVWEPLRAAIAAAAALGSFPVRGLPMVLVLMLRGGVAATSMAAGMAIFGRRPHAFPLAVTALAAAAIVDLFVYLTPYLPNNRMPGDTPFYIAASLAYNGAWIIWLVTSRRASP